MVKVLPHFPPFVFGLLYVLKCAISAPTTKQNQVDQKEVDKTFRVQSTLEIIILYMCAQI